MTPRAILRKLSGKNNSCKQLLLVKLCQGVLLGRLPDGKAESDLVHEVSKVVHQVQGTVIDAAQQISEEVAERIDGPPDGHDEAHGAERRLHELVHLVSASSHITSLTHEDLKQDEAPSSHAECEAQPSVEHASLTYVAESQHRNGAKQQAPEHACTDVGLHS